VPFTPLRVRSHGSLLYGTAAPEALLARAGELGYRALALTDRDNLYLAIRFYQAAHAAGLAPLLGAEVSDGRRSALLLALDRRGYTHLCEVLTLRHLDTAFDLVAALAPRHAGLHVIVESPGLLATLVAAGVPPAAGAAAPRRARDGGLWCGVRGLPARACGTGAPRGRACARRAARRDRRRGAARGERVRSASRRRDGRRRRADRAHARGGVLRRQRRGLASPPVGAARACRVRRGAHAQAAELALANNAALVARSAHARSRPPDLPRRAAPAEPAARRTSPPSARAGSSGATCRTRAPRPARSSTQARDHRAVPDSPLTSCSSPDRRLRACARHPHGRPRFGRQLDRLIRDSASRTWTRSRTGSFERFLHPARRDARTSTSICAGSAARK
jgi:hypothetical protein